MLRVDIGCGDAKPANYIGVDICPGPGVDIVADISQEFPFPDSSVDELRAHDVVEHLPDRIRTMNEIWRVCKPGARVDLLVPSTDGRGAFQDPTHISFWNINSFKYFCVEFPPYFRLCRKYGFQGAFRLLRLEHIESADQVIHVQADLEVIKPFPDESEMAAHPESGTLQRPMPTFPTIAAVTTSKPRPFWSVMIPVYNPNPLYLEQTLRGVLEQDPGIAEMQIEVVDDASTEGNVAELVQAIGQGRISLYRQPTNLGLIANWNACLQRASGHWVHLLHQDDLVLPGFYARLQSALAPTSEIGAAFCRHRYIDKTGQQHQLSSLERPTPGVLEHWLEQIAVVQRIQFAAIVVQRTTYETLGGFCPEAASAADWEMWKRIAVHYPVWFEPEPLACYRQHRYSESSRLIQTGANIADTRRAIEISQAYLPPAIAVPLSNQARDHYAHYALNTARHLLAQAEPAAAIAQLREALHCSQSPAVKAELIDVLLDSPPAEAVDPQVSDWLRQLEGWEADPTALSPLAELRQQIAEQWLKLPADQLEAWYSGGLSQIYPRIRASGLYYQPLTPTEQTLVEALTVQVSAAKTPNLAAVLAAMLYRQAHQFSFPIDLTSLPTWFASDYLQFVLAAPALFQEVGEADRYYHHLQSWVTYLHTHCLANPESDFWQTVASRFSQIANFIQVYFNRHNLKDLFVKRAELLSFDLSCQGHALDYDVPERSPDRPKLRLGILASHFTPQTETFSTLPAYEYLDRDEFEIILFALVSTNHRLERYCAGHADALVVLPRDLAKQVQVIREADLDVLLIGTNLTAVNHPLVPLALHRLARVQATLYSSPVTTGMPHVDYYISGRLTEPESGAEAHYSEQLVTLEGLGYCFHYALEPKPTKTGLTREALGIAPEAVVLTSGANFFKIIPELRETWATILAALSDAVLVLYPFGASWSDSYERSAFTQQLQAIFDRYGIARDRLILLDSIPIRADVKEYLKLADVYLDSFPYTGSHATTDPLEVGLPTVTLTGETLRSRQGPALLRALQIPELITETAADYIQLAIALGRDPALRQQMRERIQQRLQQPTCFDSRQYSAQVGALLKTLVQRYHTGELQHQFRLRALNWIAFPDWSLPEAEILETLLDLLRFAVTHPAGPELALLIHIGSFDEAEADLAVSSVLMHLLTEEGIDVSEAGPEVVLVTSPSPVGWQRLLPHLSTRIELATEDQQAIARSGSANLPRYRLAG